MTPKLRSLPALGAFFVVVIGLSACGDARSRQRGRARRRRRPSRRTTFDHWMSASRRLVASQPDQGAPKVSLDAARVQGLHRRQAEDRAQARQGPAEADGRAVQAAVQAGVRGPARSGPPVPDPREVGHGRGRATRASRSPTRRSTSSSRRRRSSPSRRRRTSRTSSSPRDDARGPAVPGQARHALQQAAREDHQGQGQGHRRGRSRSTTTRTRPASRQPEHARPAHRPDEDRGQGQRGQGGARRRPDVQGRREEVLDRPGLQGAGRLLLAVAKGQQEKALDDAVFTAKKGELSARSRRSSATTSSRSRRSPRPRSRRWRRPGDDQAAARLAGPAEGRRQVQHRVPLQVEGRPTASRLRHPDCKNAPKPKTTHRRRPRPARAAARRRSAAQRRAPGAPPRQRRAPIAGSRGWCPRRATVRDQRRGRAP